MRRSSRGCAGWRALPSFPDEAHRDSLETELAVRHGPGAKGARRVHRSCSVPPPPLVSSQPWGRAPPRSPPPTRPRWGSGSRSVPRRLLAPDAIQAAVRAIEGRCGVREARDPGARPRHPGAGAGRPGPHRRLRGHHRHGGHSRGHPQGGPGALGRGDHRSSPSRGTSRGTSAASWPTRSSASVSATPSSSRRCGDQLAAEGVKGEVDVNVTTDEADGKVRREVRVIVQPEQEAGAR